MTLSGVVLFPQAMLPLYIFEPRYQQMLNDIMDTDRMFCVAGQNDALAEATGQQEPPHDIATVGIVRASHQNDDGTSNLIVQGITRVRFTQILQEDPYRMAAVEALDTIPATDSALDSQRTELFRLLKARQKLGANISDDVIDFLKILEDPDMLIDLAAFSLCEDAGEKQRLLEILETQKRFASYLAYLQGDNERLVIENRLQGGVRDDDISLN